MVVGDDTQNQQCTLSFATEGAGDLGGIDGGGFGTCVEDIGDGGGEGEQEQPPPNGRNEDFSTSRWLFSMGMNAQV